MAKINTALISVSDKKGIVEFARELVSFGVEFISTGGTAEILKGAGLKVTEISDYTGFPEMLDGRVKTLHPKVHGGILAIRNKKEHMEQLEKAGIKTIDMVVVNLYPFVETISKPDVSLSEAIEQIDIGGPTLLRAAAKNYPFVTVVTDPKDYDRVLIDMKASGGYVNPETNFQLAKKVFRLTSEYDKAISNYLETLGER